jgi:hypothetical protein
VNTVVSGPCPVAPLVLGLHMGEQQWVRLAGIIIECIVLILALILIRRAVSRHRIRRQRAFTDSLVRQERSAVKQLRSPSLLLLCLVVACWRSWSYFLRGGHRNGVPGVDARLASVSSPRGCKG